MKEFVLNNRRFWEFIRQLRNDERVKHGIAPLAISEVHDELAEIAFFVKELRECA